MRRVLALAAFALLAGCAPPAPPPEAPATEGSLPGAAQSDPLAVAAALSVTEAIGTPVTLAPDVSRTDGEWGWLVAQPWTPEGAAIDWSQTQFAERAAQGAMDGSGTTYALLRREGDQWRVVEIVIGPTDVAWLDWAERHGAPATLIEPPAR